MPSRKGKGRQSLGFATKSQRAQFFTDWQCQLDEDYYAQKRRQQKQQQQKQQQQQQWSEISSSSSRGSNYNNNIYKASSAALRRLIAERQYWDRVEDRSWIFSHSSQQASRLAASSSYRHSTTADKIGKTTTAAAVSPPGWLVYHTTKKDETDTFAQEYRLRGTTSRGTSNMSHSQSSPPTLQSLCLHVLAQSLPDYLEALGTKSLRRYLTLLPGPALAVLSVEVSRLGFMTNDLCRVLGRHSHLTRFSLVACARCEETDPNWKDLQPNVALAETFLPRSAIDPTAISAKEVDDDDTAITTATTSTTTSTRPALLLPTIVPDSWEDLVDDNDIPHTAGSTCDGYYHNDEDDDPSTSSWCFSPPQAVSLSSSSLSSMSTTASAWRGCWPLERLELGNFPLLDVDLIQQVLAVCPLLTHLSLSGSLTYDRGPDVLWHVSQWAPRLKVLDVSGNASWVTEPLLRSVYESYYALRESTSTTTGVSIVARNIVARNIVASNAAESIEDNPLLPRPLRQQQEQKRQLQRRQRHIIVIKATGCLTRSSQIMMEGEFGTIF